MFMRASKGLLLLIFGLVAGEFCLDMVIRNNLVDWVIYFIPIYLSSKAGGRNFSYLLTGLISFLMLVALYYSPPGIDSRLALTGRGIGVCAFWLMAALIAHQKDIKNSLWQIDRALRTVSACNQALAHATSESVFLEEICRLIVDKGGYRMSWVGCAENDENKSVRIGGSAGIDEAHLAQARVSWSDTDERGRGLAGIAFRTGEMVVCNDFQNDLRTVPWHKDAVQHGYGASISLPLKSEGETFGVLMIYASRKNTFNSAELELLVALADDLAFGIHALRARAEGRRSEAALKEREEIFSSIVNQAVDAIALIEAATGRFVEFNASAHECLGYTREEFAALGIAGIQAEHSGAQIRVNIELIHQAGGHAFETRHRHRDGTLRDVRVSGRRINLRGHDYLAVIWSDITKAKEAVAALEAQRRLLADVIENSSLMICFKDREGRYQLMNRQFEESIGRKREEILGLTAGEALPGMDVEHLSQNDLAVMESGKSQTFEQTLTDATGIRTFISVKFPVRDAVEGVTGTCNMILDITERKLMEEGNARLAAAVEQTGESVMITDKQGAILYVNPVFEKTTGYTCTEVLGQNPRFLKSGQHDARFYRRMWDALERGEIWKGHFTNRRKDGSFFEEDTVISPIRNAQGAIFNYVAVKHDVTLELQLEAQFRQAQKMEVMGTLAGGIAHDFNNMLAIIYGYGCMLQNETTDNPEVQEKVGEILKAANRAKDLVRQILTFSRRGEQKRQIIRLESVLKEATKFLRASSPSSIQINLDYSADSPAVLADSTQIYQVTMNLAVNALHAMEGRQGQLTVKLEAFTPDETFIQAHPGLRLIQYARLTVADTGQGMDGKTLERIFEPFFTTKPADKGTGLGLAVVHGIVQSHNGIITVESQPGHGTTFGLYFPAAISEPDETLTEPVERAMPLGQGQKILLVDDETVVTTMLGRLLKQLNYQVTTSNSPRQTIALFSKNPDEYDLVITDLAMPEVDGLELASQLRAIRPRLPIILLSGFTATLTPENLSAAGICQVLDKPVSMMALAEAVGTLLGRAR